MNILVTGGAGFIGSTFIRLLFDESSDVNIVNLDALTYAGNKETITSFAAHAPRYCFVHGDIADQHLVEHILVRQNIDVIINFAAESHVDRSIKNAQPFIHSNVEGTRSLLDAARTVGIQRFVQISTDEVYGSTASGIFTETTPLQPRSPYAASKAAADLLTQAYFVTHQLPVIITRSSNNYGPYQYPEKFIPTAITNLIEEKKIPVYASGKNIRDWLHVIDNCRAILAVLEHGRLGEIYNISGDNERENITIARQIAAAFSKGDEAITFVADRPGHDFRYALSSAKIQQELAWKPGISLEQGLSSTIQWYRDNQSWWKPLK